MTNDLELLEVPVQKMIVIGDADLKSNKNVHVCKDFDECLKYLFRDYSNMIWWLVGDNELVNGLIWKGIVMDVHLSKSYADKQSQEYKSTSTHLLYQPIKFNKALLETPSMEFELVSGTFDMGSSTKSHRHFMRRNVEETRLLSTVNEIMTFGHLKPNRTGIDTRSLFGKQFEYRLTERIDPNTGKSSFRLPLLTTKRMFQKSIFAELLWFMRGETDSKIPEKQGVNIWKGNSSRRFLDSVGLNHYKEGECGKIYGHQFRNFSGPYQNSDSGKGIDQVSNVIKSLQEDPFGRRHVISLWNASDQKECCLSPCHVLYIFYVHEENGCKYLSLSMTQRSADSFLGIPFNIVSCSMFLMMMAHRVGMKAHTFVHSITDMHVYLNHFEAANKQILREPHMFPYASIACDPSTNFEDYQLTDFQIDAYHHHNRITAPMAA